MEEDNMHNVLLISCIHNVDYSELFYRTRLPLVFRGVSLSFSIFVPSDFRTKHCIVTAVFFQVFVKQPNVFAFEDQHCDNFQETDIDDVKDADLNTSFF